MSIVSASYDFTISLIHLEPRLGGVFEDEDEDEDEPETLHAKIRRVHRL